MSRLFSVFLSHAFLYDSFISMLGKASVWLNVAISVAVLGICTFFVVAHFRFERNNKQK
ncbi:MAG: hypothetical protein J6R40_04825 [Clostridia bacterium]|nr:hypothetical protein [Clostridia bacterium]